MRATATGFFPEKELFFVSEKQNIIGKQSGDSVNATERERERESREMEKWASRKRRRAPEVKRFANCGVNTLIIFADNFLAWDPVTHLSAHSPRDQTRQIGVTHGTYAASPRAIVAQVAVKVEGR